MHPTHPPGPLHTMSTLHTHPVLSTQCPPYTPTRSSPHHGHPTRPINIHPILPMSSVFTTPDTLPAPLIYTPFYPRAVCLPHHIPRPVHTHSIFLPRHSFTSKQHQSTLPTHSVLITPYSHTPNVDFLGAVVSAVVCICGG